MLHYLRIAVTALSLTACALLVALWVRSYWWQDSFTLGCAATGGINASSLCGIMGFSYHPEFGTEWRTDRLTPEIKSYWQEFAGDSALIGFGIARFLTITVLLVPHWFQITLFAFIAAVPWLPWSRRFSLRTLLIATTLVAVGLGVVIYAAK